MKPTRILSASAAALLATAFLFAPAAHAQTFPNLTYYVTIQNLNLLPSANGDYSLDLQLLTGSGNQTNTVTLSNFVFTGGTASGTPDFTNGNETGSLASSVVLTSNSNPNTAIDNEFAEAMSAGVTQISFKVSQTPNSETVTSGTAAPEQLNVAILDNGLNDITTTDPTGDGNLVSSPLGETSTLATVNTYSGTGADAGVTVVVGAEAVPEPRSVALGLLAAGVMFGLLRKRFVRLA
jgi:hypothetical protein